MYGKLARLKHSNALAASGSKMNEYSRRLNKTIINVTTCMYFITIRAVRARLSATLRHTT